MIATNIDILRARLRNKSKVKNSKTQIIVTSFGKIRVLDTEGNKPVLINAPDLPNVIEHHELLISQLAVNFRVICFEFPGSGLSQPNSNFDYSINNGGRLIIDILNILEIRNAIFSFSCSNAFYAIKAAELYPDRVSNLFLSQSCSISSLQKWSKKSIPTILTIPVIGQISNAIFEKRIAKTWYNYALPRETNNIEFKKLAADIIENGGCFCLSSLVQSLNKEINTKLKVKDINSTLIWGAKDFTHRLTNSNSILEMLPNCEIIEFENCGHFPELENSTRFAKIINDKVFL